MTSLRYEEKFSSIYSIFEALKLHKSIAILGMEFDDYEEVFSFFCKTKFPKSKYLFLDGQVFPGLSVVDNILFHANKGTFIGKRKRIEEIKVFCEQNRITLDFKALAQDVSIDMQRIINLLSAYYANVNCVVVKDCMSDMSLGGSNIYCSILERMKATGCKIIYLTTRWEDSVKIADWIMLMPNGILEKSFDASFVRSNPRELVQLLGSGIYSNGENQNTMFSQAMEAMVQVTDIISSSYHSSSLEDMTGIIQKALNATGGFLHLKSSESTIEIPNEKKSEVNFATLCDYMENNKQNTFYWSIRDSWYADLFNHKADLVKSVLAVPVRYHDDFLGVCGVWFDYVFLYSQENILTLTTLANEVVILIETAHLMNRSLLLQESHHRIKNNLQMIISLLYIQKEQWASEQRFADAIDSTIGRIKSVSSVHDVLSGDTYGVGSIELSELTECILKMYDNVGIEFNVEIEPIYVVQKFAVSIALILNELLSNCFKHAFSGLPKDRSKKVEIQIYMRDESVVIKVKDNGIGIPDKPATEQSIGMKIVYSLVESDMDGHIYFENRDGTEAKVVLPICNSFTKYFIYNPIF